MLATRHLNRLTTLRALKHGRSISHLPSASPEEFVEEMKGNGLRRAFLLKNDQGLFEPSHSLLKPLADHFNADHDFHSHEGCFFEVSEVRSELCRTCRFGVY